ncbi:hypothetical protein MRX96_059620 [Rhipicephalus microplus]
MLTNRRRHHLPSNRNQATPANTHNGREDKLPPHATGTRSFFDGTRLLGLIGLTCVLDVASPSPSKLRPPSLFFLLILLCDLKPAHGVSHASRRLPFLFRFPSPSSGGGRRVDIAACRREPNQEEKTFRLTESKA